MTQTYSTSPDIASYKVSGFNLKAVTNVRTEFRPVGDAKFLFHFFWGLQPKQPTSACWPAK